MATLLATGWDAVNRFRKIEEATAPKDDPAPVYLLDEIADMAKQSPEAATAIAEAVQKKLASKNPVTKFKALRIIKHLSTKGCSQFQRCMQRHSTCVRELTHWRGEPDPYKGDVPNARVREFAKEVVEVMFNSSPAQSNANTLAAQGKIQGFGNENSGGHFGGISSSNSGQYGGIGSHGSGGFSAQSSRASGIGGGIPTSFAEAQRAASQFTQAAQQALGEGPLAQGISNVLGGFLQPTGYSGRLNDSGLDDGTYQPTYDSAASYAAPAVSQVTASQVLGGESALVDDITTPGGVRALPDPADLRRFVDTASSMDGLRVAELLREKLESPRWQVVLRALAALEAVLQRGSSQACGEIAVMFQSDPSPVNNALRNPQVQVQQLAAATLKLLTGEEVHVAAAATTSKKGSTAAAAAAAAKAPMMDLLIDDTPSSSEAVSSAAAPASGIELLGDLTEPAAPAAAGVDSLFDGLGVHTSSSGAAAPAAVPAAAAPAASNGDMFGGLTVTSVATGPHGSTASHAAAAAPTSAHAAPGAAAPAASQHAAPLDELFAGLTTGSTGISNGISVLGSLSQPPLMQQQQQQHLGLGGQQQLQQQLQQQQHQQQQQFDWLGGDLGVPGPKMQQPNIGFQPLQVNGLPQPGPAGPGKGQWSMGQIPAHTMPSGLNLMGQAGPAMGQASAAGFSTGVAGGIGVGSLSGGMQHGHGGSVGTGNFSSLVKGGSLQGASGGGAAWSGHDDVSNLMRQVAHGGKYDPAFDFVSDLMQEPKAK